MMYSHLFSTVASQEYDLLLLLHVYTDNNNNKNNCNDNSIKYTHGTVTDGIKIYESMAPCLHSIFPSQY